MKTKIPFVLLIVASCFNASRGDDMKSHYIQSDFIPDANVMKPVWSTAKSEAVIVSDWRGAKQYPQYKTTVRSLWSDSFLYLIYSAPFDEFSTDASLKADAAGDSFGIWKHDAVEVFITGNPDVRRYYEFVVSPLGQKIDISHDKNKPEPNCDPNWRSDWKVAVKLNDADKTWITELRIPFSSITQVQAVPGRKFKFNLFRIVGAGAEAKYLAMNPTGTEKPKFHVPEKFGTLVLEADDLKLSAPVLFLDFEKPLNSNQDRSAVNDKILKGQGVAGSNCFDAAKGPLRIADQNLLKNLDCIKSFTITGWFKSKVDFDDVNNSILISCPGRFMLASNGLIKGRLGVELIGSEKKGAIWSSWFSLFLSDERWMFFAFTYDSSEKSNNGRIYVGTEEYPLEMETVTTETGPLLHVDTKEFLVGAGNAKGSNRFNGKLDQIRIFASSSDNSGALSAVEIELLRQTDVGKEYASKIAEKRAEKQNGIFAARRRVADTYWNREFNAMQVDSLDRVFPDMPPSPREYNGPVSVPRGGKIAFQVAVMSKEPGICNIQVLNPDGFDGNSTSTYRVRAVPVEANNNGGSRTSVTSVPPALWLEAAIRKAPFEIAEVLIPSQAMELRAGRYEAILIDLNVPINSRPGIYKAGVRLSSSGHSIEIPLEFQVHKTTVTSGYAMDSIHWLWPEPENLTNENIPQWWSERHWKLLEQAGLQLLAYGQNTMFTPLIDGEHPLIKTIRKKDGTFAFNFSQFNRWVEMFSKQGFVAFDGHHIGGGHYTSPMHVVAVDETNNVNYTLFTGKSDPNTWFAFIPVFYEALYKDLKSNGYLEKYHQCQLDEPGSEADYKRLAALTRKYMPGVLTKDAINGNPAKYSPLVDIQVFGVAILNTGKEIANERKKNGQKTWVYHCCSPYPPMPNRHLDDPLSMSRLYPWLAFQLNAEGYLMWSANILRGADPYKTSIGPMPKGSQNPGHPPGDNWFYYPGPDGLYGTMRMMAFRDGMLDHKLLTMLAQKDRKTADTIAKGIAISLIDYQKDPASYHKARRELLTTLDKLDSNSNASK